jgi:hypothetical protein
MDIVTDVDEIAAIERGVMDRETLEAYLERFLKNEHEAWDDFGVFTVRILEALCDGAVSEAMKTLMETSRIIYDKSPVSHRGFAAFLASKVGDLKPQDEPLVVLGGILARRTGPKKKQRATPLDSPASLTVPTQQNSANKKKPARKKRSG